MKTFLRFLLVAHRVVGRDFCSRRVAEIVMLRKAPHKVSIAW